MALRAIEGFDAFNSISQIGGGRKFRLTGDTGSFTFVSGRLGGKALKLGVSSFGALNLALVSSDAIANPNTAITGVAVRVDSLTSNERVILCMAASGIVHMMVSVSAAGYVEIRGPTGALLATSTDTFLQIGQWYYLEVTHPISASGTFVVRVNGEAAVSYFGNLVAGSGGAALVNEVLLGCGVSGIENCGCTYDDFYLIDDTGTDSNARLGDSRVELRRPTADFELDFAIVGDELTGFASLRDTASGPDGDLTAISSATVTDRAILTSSEPLSSSPRVIHGVSVQHISRKDGADARALKVVLASGATEVSSTPRALFDNYTTDEALFSLDPNTSAEWTEAAIVASKFGVEVTS